MRRSAASQRSRAVPGSPDCSCDASEGVESEDLDSGVVLLSGAVEDRHQPLLGTGDLFRGVQRGQQALAEQCLLPTTSGAVPVSRRFEFQSALARSAPTARRARPR